jgi:excisionase family DNA binding protein
MTDERTAPEETAEELLTIDEAARFLDTSKSTIYRILSLDTLKGTKVGKQWRFRKADLTAYLERSPATVTIAVAAQADLERELEFFAGELRRAGLDPEIELPTRESITAEAPIVTLANRILLLAITARASDFHLERAAEALRLRFRIDGVLQDIRRIPASLHDAIIARFKEMSYMDLLEKLPQDGRIRFEYEGVHYDLRSNVIRAAYGDSMAIGNLGMTSVRLDLDRLGAGEPQVETLRRWIHRPSGMFITTGPGGSGKTTLIYSCLREIDAVEKKLFTVESPWEVMLPDVVQTMTHKHIGLTFAVALRCAVRQQADVIFCAELPDLETAEVAVESAVTGHLLMTTLHAEDAPSALVTLAERGIPPYLLASAMTGVVAQRLARRLCPHCKAPADTAEIARTLERVRPLVEMGGYRIPEGAAFSKTVGCDACRKTGYQGRIGLFEILTCTPRLVDQLLKCTSHEERIRLAVAHGMRTLLADGLSKAVDGETTIEEVLRATATRV